VTARGWDARTYHRVSNVQFERGLEVLDRLPLRGDETVLDAGCGSGRVTQVLERRLPRGRVVAVDADAAMAAEARANLSDRAEVIVASLTDLALAEPVDAAFSNAVFHWVLDHDRLFERLHAALRPGGRLVAQCGAAGNIECVLSIVDDVAARPEYADAFRGWIKPYWFPTAEETRARLERAGFVEARCWVEGHDAQPEEPRAFVETVCLGQHLERLPDDAREPFLNAVLDRAGEPLRLNYVRLNIDAWRAA
jgi:trans-aconitate 2-methyltransferase